MAIFGSIFEKETLKQMKVCREYQTEYRIDHSFIILFVSSFYS